MVDDPMLELDGDTRQGKAPKRTLLEKDIENAVCRYAKTRHDMKAEKFVSPGRRSVPDRMFSDQGGFCFFIEFKAPGKTATEKQKRDHDERRKLGFRVFVIDDINEGKRIIDKMAGLAALRNN